MLLAKSAFVQTSVLVATLTPLLWKFSRCAASRPAVSVVEACIEARGLGTRSSPCAYLSSNSAPCPCRLVAATIQSSSLRSEWFHVPHPQPTFCDALRTVFCHEEVTASSCSWHGRCCCVSQLVRMDFACTSNCLHEVPSGQAHHHGPVARNLACRMACISAACFTWGLCAVFGILLQVLQAQVWRCSQKATTGHSLCSSNCIC